MKLVVAVGCLLATAIQANPDHTNPDDASAPPVAPQSITAAENQASIQDFIENYGNENDSIQEAASAGNTPTNPQPSAEGGSSSLSGNTYTYNRDGEVATTSTDGGIEIQEDCWTNITDRINDFFREKFPQMINGESSYTDIEILSCYGCWCNRDEYFGRGMGDPRDAFDAVCKFHHQAYECIEIDAEDRGEACDPVAVSNEGFKFRMDLSFNNGRGGMNLQCDQNQSWCKQRVCEADLQYIKDFVRTALAGHRVRRDLYGHREHIDAATGLPTGYFEPQVQCPLGGSLHTPYKKCCGAYPRRRVFKTDTLEDEGSYRQCCDFTGGDNDGSSDGAVFYPASQVCCAEHGVQNGEDCELYEPL